MKIIKEEIKIKKVPKYMPEQDDCPGDQVEQQNKTRS